MKIKQVAAELAGAVLQAAFLMGIGGVAALVIIRLTGGF